MATQQAFWSALSAVALGAGLLMILAPALMMHANKQLSRVLVSVDDVVMHHRHVVGMLLLIVGYLCFSLAMAAVR